MPYEEIARSGGGIALERARLRRRRPTTRCSRRRGRSRAEMLAARDDGVRGQDRLRALGRRRGARRCACGRELGADRVTGLFAHAVPQGYDARRAGWTRSTRWPRRATSTRSTSTSSRSPSRNEHLARLGAIAAREGVPLRAHVEQFNANRSVPVALAAGARSVDHLACLHPDDIAPLAAAECAAVLLPGAEFLGAERVAPARELADAGAICVLATDCNPGTSPISSLPVIIGLAVRRYGWSVREALLACTLNAAWVLGLSGELGLARGRQARRPRRSSTRPSRTSPTASGATRCASVIRAGEVAWVRPDAAWRVRVVIAADDLARRLADLEPIGLDERGDHAAGLDAPRTRPPARGSRAARDEVGLRVERRPRRQPLGGARRARAVVGRRLAPRQRARAAGATTARSASCAGVRRRRARAGARSSPSPTRRARASTRRRSAAARWPACSTRRRARPPRRRRRAPGRRDGAPPASTPPASREAPGVARAPARLPRAAHRPDARPRALRASCARSRRGCACRPTCTAAPTTPARRAATSAATRSLRAAILIVAADQRADATDMVVTAVADARRAQRADDDRRATSACGSTRARENPVGAHARWLAATCPTGAELTRAPSRSDGVDVRPRAARRARRPRAASRASPATTRASSPAKIPAAMVLVRNPSGISHSPEEAADLDDAAARAPRAIAGGRAMRRGHDRRPCPTRTRTPSSATCAALGERRTPRRLLVAGARR